MGEFYAVLAGYYDELFPLKEQTSAFVRSFFQDAPANYHILDVGCATGQLALHLAQQDFDVTAIEPDETMVTLAWQRMATHPDHDASMVKAGMLDLDCTFPGETFDAVLCLGNTLVHLQSLDEVRQFFAMVYRHLTPGGPFILQIVNYTRILSQNVTELPFIDRPSVSIERRYRLSDRGDKIHFVTRLKLKETGQAFESETTLLPLQWQQLEPIFAEAGFPPPQIFGDFNRSPYTPDSPGLIVAFA